LNAEGLPTCKKDPGRCPARFGGQPILVPVKSRAGRRTWSLPRPLVEQLRRHLANQAAERLRAGSRWQDNGLIFAREDGSPIRKETDSGEWHRIFDSPMFAKAAFTTRGIRPRPCSWFREYRLR
jgi:hypothetical protein